MGEAVHRALCRWLGLALCALPPTALGAAAPAEGQKSGYQYQSADTRSLQDDDFANPGLLWVDRGQTLWQQAPSATSKACSTCHGSSQDDAPAGAAMAGVVNRYPRYDRRLQRPINLEQRINRCRQEHQQQPPFAYESEPLLALTAFIAQQSRGLPTTIEITPELEPFLAAGRKYFYERRGQMNLACHHCHERYAGRMLRGDRLSQGHSNGYPLYRLEWQTLGSLHRRLRFCNAGVRAEPFAYGAAEYVNLELFLRWRGQGLPVETPAVRR